MGMRDRDESGSSRLKPADGDFEAMFHQLKLVASNGWRYVGTGGAVGCHDRTVYS